VSSDEDILDAAREYSSNEEWARRSDLAVEFLTIINEDLTVIFASNLPPGDDVVTGRSCLDFMPAEHHEQFQLAVAKTIETGLPWHYEIQAPSPDGAMSYYSSWATLLAREPSGCRIAIVGTDISHVRRVEEELALSDETLRSLVTGASDYIAVVDKKHNLTFLNRQIQPDSMADIAGRPVELFVAEEDRKTVKSTIDKVFREGTFESYVTSVTSPTDEGSSTRIFNTRLSPIYRNDEVVSVTLISTDVTQYQRDQVALRDSQDRLRQSQQLQAIGQLTGGIAHDFNNLLMVMQGSLHLAQESLGDREAALGLMDDALKAADRAADLTQRLLAFGRRQSLQPLTIDPAELLDSMSTMMKRTLGTQVTVRTEVETGAWGCFADRVQLESALLNLAINARDALGVAGGLLSLVASNWLESATSEEPVSDLQPGGYLRIDVVDDGPGIPPDVLNRAFEPFFTTKGVGHGSGLGLSMVYGFAQQSGGLVTMTSSVGEGTTVSLYLPRSSESVADEAEPTGVPSPKGLGIHVLVVEDIPEVARVTRRILEMLGYRVTCAENAEAALELLPNLPDAQVLLTDVGFPGRLNGVALCHEVRRARPDMLVLFMTGYDNGLLDGEPDVTVVKKPFTPADLAKALEELVGTPTGA